MAVWRLHHRNDFWRPKSAIDKEVKVGCADPIDTVISISTLNIWCVWCAWAREWQISTSTRYWPYWRPGEFKDYRKADGEKVWPNLLHVDHPRRRELPNKKGLGLKYDTTRKIHQDTSWYKVPSPNVDEFDQFFLVFHGVSIFHPKVLLEYENNLELNLSPNKKIVYTKTFVVIVDILPCFGSVKYSPK